MAERDWDTSQGREAKPRRVEKVPGSQGMISRDDGRMSVMPRNAGDVCVLLPLPCRLYISCMWVGEERERNRLKSVNVDRNMYIRVVL